MGNEICQIKIQKMKNKFLIKKSRKLSILGVDIYNELIKLSERVISRQFLKSCTSIGANIHEAFEAESKKDFIHKLSISLKEARETEYWVYILEESSLVDIEIEKFSQELNSMIAVLVTALKNHK